ncbi:50S ribosomal protein L21 [Patescibacteria group bacterium]|nr:50S ribosomal protein L21 [Patescibacteria group bacterium]MBU2263367.1 50S ribosomal protein L21 [Patescibacteria group bacterium]
MSKLAVIQTGGKQYLVKIGETLKIEKIKTEGDSVVFNDVLLVIDGDSAGGGVKIGTPVVQGAKVTAKVEGDIRGKKITVLKYKPKVRYRVKKGHRQNYTKITITDIK